MFLFRVLDDDLEISMNDQTIRHIPRIRTGHPLEKSSKLMSKKLPTVAVVYNCLDSFISSGSCIRQTMNLRHMGERERLG